LFAGSGTVAGALAHHRNVVAVDIQEYSRVLCSALLHPADLSAEDVRDVLQHAGAGDHTRRLQWVGEPLVTYESHCLELAEGGDLEPLCELMEQGSLIGLEHGQRASSRELRDAQDAVQVRMSDEDVDPRSMLVARYYGGVYFSFRQALQLDALLESVARLGGSRRDTLLAAVLSTASEVVNTVGKQFAQPIRPRSRSGEPKDHLIRKIVRDRDNDVLEVYAGWLERYRTIPSTGRPHSALQGDYASFLQSYEGRLGAIYADPPYTRDHYSRFYHVLETLCLRDSPRVSTTRLGGEQRMSRGMYRHERHQSPFCIKTQAPGAFGRLFVGARRFEVPLVVSYSPFDEARGARPRLMTVDGIVALAREHYRRVEVISAGDIAHNKLNTADRNVGMSYDAEVLVTCEP
jgi:hypothetical protein